MYGCEGWTLLKADEKRIEAAKMWLLRRMMNIRWTERKTNNTILRKLRIERSNLSTLREEKRATFLDILYDM